MKLKDETKKEIEIKTLSSLLLATDICRNVLNLIPHTDEGNMAQYVWSIQHAFIEEKKVLLV